MNLSWQWVVLVASGGAAGAVVRGVVAAAWQTRFPWATLAVNALGALLIGWLMARIPSLKEATALNWQALLVTGFCGGFTTFSAFSWQTLVQLNEGRVLAATANVTATVALCLLAVWVGFRLGH